MYKAKVMPKYIDAHCHLLDAPNIDLAMSNALEKGITAFICAPAAPEQWAGIVELTHKNQKVFGCVGIHPWNVCELPQNWMLDLEKILIDNPKIMVGEIGLDKNRPNIDLQTDIFTRQLKIAHEYSRGIHLHCVGCWESVLRILDENKNALPSFILAHGFTGRAEDIKNIADKYNVYFSYGPRTLGQKLGAGRILKTPLSRILTESDGADSTVIPSLVSQMSEILNVETDILADIIYKNITQIL